MRMSREASTLKEHGQFLTPPSSPLYGKTVGPNPIIHGPFGKTACATWQGLVYCATQFLLWRVFSELRRDLLRDVMPVSMHIFQSRDHVFKGDEVLQEAEMPSHLIHYNGDKFLGSK